MHSDVFHPLVFHFILLNAGPDPLNFLHNVLLDCGQQFEKS